MTKCASFPAAVITVKQVFEIKISVKNSLTILLFQDHNSRYSKDLMANSLRFFEGIQENERQVELVKL